MSGEEGPTMVPVDVVLGIVQQLATVSQHTTTATTAMRHLVAEIMGMREMRTMDTTTMVEAAAASWRSGSAGVVDGGVVRTTDPADSSAPACNPDWESL